MSSDSEALSTNCDNPIVLNIRRASSILSIAIILTFLTYLYLHSSHFSSSSFHSAALFVLPFLNASHVSESGPSSLPTPSPQNQQSYYILSAYRSSLISLGCSISLRLRIHCPRKYARLGPLQLQLCSALQVTGPSRPIGHMWLIL